MEEKSLSIFKFEEKELRTVIINNEVWFVAKDVCNILEYSNSSKAVKDNVHNIRWLTKSYIPHPQSTEKQLEVVVISEFGLYALIMNSHMEKAERFQDWVYEEVLPSIRKTGKYLSKELTKLEILEMAIESEKKLLQSNFQLEMQKPKVEFFDAVADSKDAIDMQEAAKVLEFKPDVNGKEIIGRNKLFDFLRKIKIFMPDSIIPYQKYIDAGYFRVIEQKYTKNGEVHINLKTLVYQKGLDCIRKLLENHYYKKSLVRIQKVS